VRTLKDKMAIITGAAMGNGEGIAKNFVKNGAYVVL
jgi:NADP-dependent 3-hydroxy acid dehydrogenase YdfG